MVQEMQHVLPPMQRKYSNWRKEGNGGACREGMQHGQKIVLEGQVDRATEKDGEESIGHVFISVIFNSNEANSTSLEYFKVPAIEKHKHSGNADARTGQQSRPIIQAQPFIVSITKFDQN
ncbi:hypothetical protein NC653_015125 [Populus alba x Populus x berolinensis]|uniref:Uncharacterized protein n=1 Tax=Populus alba x Populus x berolinensis TaxID=444605 RepID=A0AAD6QZ13_9ROSI|nr:hypothetical protein NC653_015091 [Populus alba x Populus x berolinensis]KAJ6999153.1 hypothetical protein NC653_015095 [Populus alba x Populus x berolinensis]KAJ6999187.1 hypothetical protein NC653_015125 [Populus alba x Populus x berolinensis]